MSNKRYHPPASIAEHPMIKNAFQVIGAVLIATNGKDLEVDFTMADESGHFHQFHIDVSEVAKNEVSQ